MRKAVLPFLNGLSLPKVIQLFMNLSSPERPNYDLVTKKNSINFLEIVLEGIVMNLAADEEKGNTPFISCFLFPDPKHRAEPSVVVIVVLHLFSQLYNNLAYMPGVHCRLTAQ